LGVRGTRILVAALFEYLEDGVTLGEFVELLLDVTQEQAERVLGNVSRLGGGLDTSGKPQTFSFTLTVLIGAASGPASPAGDLAAPGPWQQRALQEV
jgi:hypothetical protein